MKGQVKWFSAKKGYGFIEAEDGKDVFVHFSNIKMEGYKVLDKGDKVDFEVQTIERGIQAINVVLTEKAKKEVPA